MIAFVFGEENNPKPRPSMMSAAIKYHSGVVSLRKTRLFL
jgi:hypothetical protein